MMPRPDLWAITEGPLDISLAAGEYARIVTSDRPIGLPLALEDARAADYDGDGRADLVTFDGISKQVWLGNTRLEDGLPLEVWSRTKTPIAKRARSCPLPRISSSPQAIPLPKGRMSGASSRRLRNRLRSRIGESTDVRRVPRMDRWSDRCVGKWGAECKQGTSPRRIRRSVLCECWDTPMLRSEVASLFGQFLTQRHGGVPSPHRWVLHAVTYLPGAQSPSW